MPSRARSKVEVVVFDQDGTFDVTKFDMMGDYIRSKDEVRSIRRHAVFDAAKPIKFQSLDELRLAPTPAPDIAASNPKRQMVFQRGDMLPQVHNAHSEHFLMESMKESFVLKEKRRQIAVKEETIRAAQEASKAQAFMYLAVAVGASMVLVVIVSLFLLYQTSRGAA